MKVSASDVRTGIGILTLAALCSVWPVPLAVIACLIWIVALTIWLPPELEVAIPLALLLIIPTDYLAPFASEAYGVPTMLTLCALMLVSALKGPSVRIVGKDWDVLGLVAILAFASMINRGTGQLRSLLFWLAGLVGVLWLRQVGRRVPGTEAQIMVAILVAGSVGGLVAGLDYFVGVDLGGLIPGYEPNHLQFSWSLGERSAGLSGHPLRLGTITMLSAVISFMTLASGTRILHRPWLYRTALALSVLGLIVAGARGAWLGSMIGLTIGGTVLARKFGIQRLAQVGVALFVIGLCVWISGLGEVVGQRMFGTANQPGSFNQRYQALLAVREVLPSLPPLGVGFGGADEVTGDVGLRLPNLENEYLRLLLAAGALGPIALLILGIRRIAHSVKQSASPTSLSVTAALGALVINVGTYNTFSWSVGPTLLFAVAVCAIPMSGNEEAASAGPT